MTFNAERPNYQPVAMAVSQRFIDANDTILPRYIATDTVDVRWSGVLKADDAPMDTVTITMDQWYMSETMRDKYAAKFIDEPGFGYNHKALRLIAMSDEAGGFLYNLNAVLAVIAHYGFDVDYDKRYALMLEPFIGELLLHAWRDETQEGRRDRIIAGKRMERAAFITAFDAWLSKYGM